MNKFAKYVPESDKKKQREFIGVSDVMTVNVTSSFTNKTCSFDKTVTEIFEHYTNGGDIRIVVNKSTIGRIRNITDSYLNIVYDFLVDSTTQEYHNIVCGLDKDNNTYFKDYLIASMPY